MQESERAPVYPGHEDEKLFHEMILLSVVGDLISIYLLYY